MALAQALETVQGTEGKDQEKEEKDQEKEGMDQETESAKPRI
jgi:hypothetical protein